MGYFIQNRLHSIELNRTDSSMIAITSFSGMLPRATSLPRRVLHTWLACYTLILSSFCSLAHAGTHEPEPPIPDCLPADVEKVLRDYENAWKSGDAIALAALFEDDGYVLSPGNPPVHGRSAIEAAYQTAGGDLYLRGIAHETSGALPTSVGAYRSATRSGRTNRQILSSFSGEASTAHGRLSLTW